ncbi:S8 family serine peptidase [Abyssicoccus albus]|uniref:S8 family serine peptidase n=1 Tax=Abyssicoccus albus TaxID=1817405 RepID=UPI00097E1DB8|nr:S8 family serine peptidase [Abyssicoccus albus]AQL56745.1 hypothetical protein BVH56_07345 [Abyssicoccus albus]
MRRKLKNVTFLFLLLCLIVSTVITPISQAAELKEKTVPSESEMRQKLSIDRQLSELSGKPKLHKDLQNLTGDQLISVIVQFEEPSIGLAKGMAKSKGKKWDNLDESKQQQKIQKQKDKFNKQLSKKISKVTKGYSYEKVLNGQALTLPANQVKKLLDIEGVQLVEPDVYVQLDPSEVQTAESAKDLAVDATAEDIEGSQLTGDKFLNVNKVWEQGYKGNGVKVGVIDTGIDYFHPELEAVYKGGKNFVYSQSDYLKERPADNPYETYPSERPEHLPEVDKNGSTYYTSHGTHVAGTIAAQGDNDLGLVGIAPNVDLYAYRVLGAYGRGATSWIIAGIEESVKDGMDVINLSLGGSDNSSIAADSFATNNAMLSGVVTLVATGNSGPDRSTLGTPSTGDMVISVGNSTIPEERYSGTVQIEAGNYNKKLDVQFMAFKLNEDPAEVLTNEELVAIPNVGTAEDFNGIEVEGKVAVVSRGEIAFVDKIKHAKENGAKGVIIFNSVDGSNAPNAVDIFLGSSLQFIPTIDLSHTEGKSLFDALEANGSGKITLLNTEQTLSQGDEINSSSSRGPSLPYYDIKPDVVAPGTNILSSIPAYKIDDANADYSEAFDKYTGTSMATPHVAGISALLVQAHPEWDPFDIKVALTNTADTLDKSNYDVFDQGAGRVNPVKAVTPNVLAHVSHSTVMENETNLSTRGTLSFGQINPDPNSTQTIEKTIVIENLSSQPITYQVDVQPTHLPNGEMSGSNITVSESQFTVNEKKEIKVTLNVPKGQHSGVNDFLGYVNFNSGVGQFDMPFAANLGKDIPTGIKTYEINPWHISPNGDGVQDESNLSIDFHDPQKATLVQMYDVLNPQAGPDSDGIIGDIFYQEGLNSETNIPLTNKGTLSGQEIEFKDGIYTIDTISLAENGKLDFIYDGPFFIKTSKPNISVERLSEDGTLNINVDDAYLNWKEDLENSFVDFKYDANNYLKVTAIVKKGNKVIEEQQLNLSNDGKAEVNLQQFTKGSYTIDIDVKDAAGNVTNKALKYHGIKKSIK